MNKLSRAKGMFLGLAAGDALGAPVEFVSSANVTAHIGSLKNMKDNHMFPKGVWTDDTSMALCLGDSLFELKGYDSYDVMSRYIEWRDHGLNSYFGCGVGIGIQIDNTLSEYEREPVVPVGKERVWNAGNGSIMRLAPVVLATYDMKIEDVIRLAQVSARETHYSEEAEAGTEIFAAMLYLALHGEKKSKILDPKTLLKYSTGEVYADILARIFEKPDCLAAELCDLGGYIVDALKIAIWGLYNFDNFEKGMLEVLKLGGDTDTNCAIYGQLAGAFYGVENIPERWLGENLYESEDIAALAENLLKIGEVKILRTRFEEDAEFAEPPEKC